jgi:hypothetical protein
VTLQHFGAGDPDNVLSANFRFDQKVNMVDVRLEILLAGNEGTSQIDGGTQTTSVVPEPGAAILAGAGLLLLAGLGRARGSSAKRGEI